MSSQISKNYSNKYGVYLVGATIVILIILVLLLIANQVYNWREVENGAVIASGLGAIGTLLLALLTFMTVNQNKRLVQHQQERLEMQQAHSRPILRKVGEVKAASDKDCIQIKFENVGRGAAYDVKMRIDIIIKELGVNTAKQENDKQKMEDSPIPALLERSSPVFKNKDVSITNPGRKGGVLEKSEVAEFEPRIDYINMERSGILEVDEDYEGLPPVVVFSKLRNKLKEVGINTIALQIRVDYEDVFGESYNEKLASRIIPTTEDNVLDLFEKMPLWTESVGKGFQHINLDEVDLENDLWNEELYTQ